MENNYSKALKEVHEVLNNSEEEIITKIPNKFYEFIKDNMDKEYIASIDFFNPNWENTVYDETKAILALIYRDYLVDEETRSKLIIEEKEEQKRIESELREKYNPDNIFKNKIDISKTEEKQMIEIKALHWYQRIYQKILRLFGINKK